MSLSFADEGNAIMKEKEMIFGIVTRVDLLNYITSAEAMSPY